MSNYTTKITPGNVEIEVDVEFNYSPFVAGRPYLSNGDIGYQDEPSEVEIIKVWHGKIDITDYLADGWFSLLEEEILGENYE